jgi:hypothetical protein
MTQKQFWSLFGCVVLSAPVAAAQEPVDTPEQTAAHEVRQLRSEVNELSQQVKRLEARLAGIENLLRKLARQRQPHFSPQPATNAPLETMRLELPAAERPDAYETTPLGAEPKKSQWQDHLPGEATEWIRPPFRPSPRYDWNTFPSPPYPSGP